jgi:hypothetical protein
MNRVTGNVWAAYVKKLNVVKKVVVEGEVVARDDVDAGILLDLPVLQSQALTLLQQLVPRELVCPVGLVGLLELTIRAHAGKPENGRENHCDERSLLGGVRVGGCGLEGRLGGL